MLLHSTIKATNVWYTSMIKIQNVVILTRTKLVTLWCLQLNWYYTHSLARLFWRGEWSPCPPPPFLVPFFLALLQKYASKASLTPLILSLSLSVFLSLSLSYPQIFVQRPNLMRRERGRESKRKREKNIQRIILGLKMKSEKRVGKKIGFLLFLVAKLHCIR